MKLLYILIASIFFSGNVSTSQVFREINVLDTRVDYVSLVSGVSKIEEVHNNDILEEDEAKHEINENEENDSKEQGRGGYLVYTILIFLFVAGMVVILYLKGNEE